ncbi:MFS transporter [Streptomyces sp. NPDC006134]|uniref:MFS transporter n=1 Tax=Streptomyces sp. NPDC006134 TaxID=3154467 RepID=UPI0033ECDB47
MSQAQKAGGRGLLAVLLTGQLMANVDTAIIYVAAPSIQSGLHASGAQLELVVSGYVLSYAVLLVTGARLGDSYGHRRIFLAGLALFTATSLACGIAPEAGFLVVARILQGAGAALMVPQVLIGIQRHFSGALRARALGAYALTLGGAAVGGQVLGGLLTSLHTADSWRLIFLINVPVGVSLFPLARRLLPAPDSGARAAARLDVRGTVTLSAALLLTTVPLIVGREHGWPAWSWWCMAVGVVAGGLFLLVERRVKRQGGRPLVDLGVLARPVMSWGLTANVLGASTNFALLFVMALYLQQGLGLSPLYSGAAVMAWPVTFGLAGHLLGRFPGRFSAHPAAVGYAILAASYAAMGLCALGGLSSGAVLMLTVAVGGFGLGIGFSALLRNLTTALPERYAPEISGLVNMTTQIGGAVGVALFGGVYLMAAGSHPPTHAEQAFGITTFACSVAACLAATTAYLSLRQRAGTSRTAAGSRPEPADAALTAGTGKPGA